MWSYLTSHTVKAGLPVFLCPARSFLPFLVIYSSSYQFEAIFIHTTYIRTSVHCGEVSEEKRFWCLIQKLVSCKNLYTPSFTMHVMSTNQKGKNASACV